MKRGGSKDCSFRQGRSGPIAKLAEDGQPLPEPGSSALDTRTVKFIEGYDIINNYLQAFIDHVSTYTQGLQ